MNEYVHTMFINIVNKFFGFMPSFIVGITLIIIGWALAWFVKRTIIQVSRILKIDRALVRFHWARALSKADVRYGFYSFLGSIGFTVVFLIFLYYALISWGLDFLSEMLREGILFFPRIIAAGAVFGIGWIIAVWASRAIMKFMTQEGMPHAVAVTYYSKAVLIVLFSAMAFAELGIARAIVIIGFTAIIITMGLIAVILTAFKGRDFLKRTGKEPGQTDVDQDMDQ
jgi:hypothetical protein